MNYQHLSIEEREKLQLMLWQKQSVRVIAKELNRSPSSISREINKNRRSDGKRLYIPRAAHERAITKRSSRGERRLVQNERLRDYVIKHLKLGWSPEQIAAKAEEMTSTKISHEAIYQYIYAQVHRNGYGYIRPGCEDLRPYLARRKKRRVQKGLRASYRTDKGSLPSIDSRPQEVEERKSIGHWEDDLIVSKESKQALKTVNERVSGIVFIEKVNNKTISESNRSVAKRLQEIPLEYRKTLTRDRGSENLGHVELEQELGILCYFAHAYHSWERGSNENLNGLIRRFLPKGTDFRTVSAEQIKRIEYLINSRPRKRLGWKTPYEVFYEKTGVALLT
ncbi:MAG: IS30 family transposase [Patescibacteria group bacterium]|nr:IS30 family transposase [Patescibacteria group bacterium]